MRGLKYYLTGAVIAVAAFVGYNNFYSQVEATDCSANNVIQCGVTSVTDMRNDYNSDATKGTKNIYSYFGISSDMVNNARVVNGLVHKSGVVTVDGKTIATNALTAGRQYIPGSVKRTVGDTTFYTRAPSVSFLSSSLSAYVFTDSQGRFIGAVIKECGNPVKATNAYTPPTHPKIDLQKTVLTDRDLKEPKEHGIVGEDNPFAYRIVVKNTGDVTLKNAVVTDAAPAGVTFTSASKGAIAKNVWSYTIPELKVNESMTFLVHAVAKEQFLKEVKNTACVDAKEISGTQNACDDAWVRTHDRNVTIEKKVNGQEHADVQVGQNFVYTLVVSNKGDVALDNVVVTDNAPDGVQFISADKGTIKDNKWSMTIKSLGVGDVVTIKITAKATKQLTDRKNTACVNAPITEESPDDCDDATISTPKAEYACKALTVDKISRTEFKFTASREVKNAEYVATIFTVKDDKGATVATVRGADGVANYTQSKVGTYTVTAQIVVKVNGKEVTTAVVDACKKTFAVAALPTNPAVSIEKTVNTVEHKTVKIGENFTYELVVKNTGDVDLKNVVVSDNAPAGVTFVSTTLGSVAGNKLAATIPSLAKGASYTIKITAVVKEYVSGTLKNTACVNAPAVNPNEPSKNDDCDDATIDVTKPVIPVYTCKNLTVKEDSRTAFTFTASREVVNATYVETVFEVRNAAGTVVATFTDADGVANYNQTTVGTYMVRATIRVKVNGEVKTATSDNCVKTFVVKEAPVVNKPGVEINKYVVTPAGGNTENMQVPINTPYQYRIVVTNTGNVALKGAVVSDNAPAGVTFISASAGTVTATSWTATTDIAVGASVTFTITAKTTVESEAPIVNTACVDAAEVANPSTSSDDCDTANVTTPATPPVEMVQACNTETGKIELVEKGKENVAPYTSDLTKCEVKMCEVPGKEDLPANSPDCKEDEEPMCTIGGKGNLPADDPNCKEDEAEVPVELPKTGVAGVAASILTLGGVTTAAGYAFASRRQS